MPSLTLPRIDPEVLRGVPANHVLVARGLELRSVPRVEALLELLRHVPAGPEQGAIVRACEPSVTHVAIAAVELAGVVVVRAPRWRCLAPGGSA